ncbi:MAG: hypothetical protein V1876_01925 [Candidatus Peregrinibacteria bacterium]
MSRRTLAFSLLTILTLAGAVPTAFSAKSSGSASSSVSAMDPTAPVYPLEPVMPVEVPLPIQEETMRLPPLPATLPVVDDGDRGFQQEGEWTVFPLSGYQGDFRYAPPALLRVCPLSKKSCPPQKFTTATWVLSGLKPGKYDVYTTWEPYRKLAAGVEYTVIVNGTETLVTVNQQLGPQGPTEDGVRWQKLGTFEGQGNIRVVLTNKADGYVIADAVKVVPAGGTQCVQAGQHTPVIYNAPPCCAGLTGISVSTPMGGGETPHECMTAVGSMICSDCGNGRCESWENECNCQADCPQVVPHCEENCICEGGVCSCDLTCPLPRPLCGNGICEAGEADDTYPGVCDPVVQICLHDPSPAISSGSCPQDCSTCIKEGETSAATPYDPSCCSGLTSVNPGNAPRSDGSCPTELPAGAKLCTNCGNGTCESWENRCNCPADCPKPICGNGLCEEGEVDTVKDEGCTPEMEACLGTLVPGTCPQDCTLPPAGEEYRCATYTNESGSREVCATCGAGVCDAYEHSTSSHCTGSACTADCGGLYCPGDCEGGQTL